MIAGIWPLTSLRNAEFMKSDLRVSMPDEILARMQKAETPERRARRNPHRAGDAGGRTLDGPGGAGQRAVWPVPRAVEILEVVLPQERTCR